MTTIYIVTSSSGSYSDYETHNVCAFYSEKRANEITMLLNQAATYDKTFMLGANEAHDKYYRANPYPVFLNGKTKKQLANMPAAVTKAAQKAHIAACKKWQDDIHAADAKYIEEHYDQPKEVMALLKQFDIKPGGQSDASYDVQTIQVIDSQEDE